MFRLANNNFANILIWFVIILVGIILIFYIIDVFLKFKPFLIKAKNFFIKNVFLLLLPFPFFYLVYYYSYYLTFDDHTKALFLRKETADFLQKTSLYFFGTGVAAACLKWLNNVIFFKKQFTEVVQSKDFSDVLSQKMQILALSDDYLLQRTDLEDIWARVTICKYQQKFPGIASEIRHKMENDLFIENSLQYYYKNFRLQINFSIENDIIKIVEIASSTLVSHSNEKIELNFGTTALSEDNGEIYTKLIRENCKKDGKLLNLEELIPNQNENTNSFVKIKNFKAELEGQTKYIIERHIEMTQNIKDDRVYSFSSSRIIEDLTINLKYDSALNLFFSPVGKNDFKPDNQFTSERSISMISRDLLLPGEKFKVFIYKNN